VSTIVLYCIVLYYYWLVKQSHVLLLLIAAHANRQQINQSIDQSIDRSIDQSINQSINQSASQPGNQNHSVNRINNYLYIYVRGTSSERKNTEKPTRIRWHIPNSCSMWRLYVDRILPIIILGCQYVIEELRRLVVHQSPARGATCDDNTLWMAYDRRWQELKLSQSFSPPILLPPFRMLMT